ncbi:DUF2336 domain-containing protein [Sphingomonas sp. GCM10030256]|uniref:DUF2336 domain-containing protein n=1 Tax=Sphingomonas sp. GCM10030256 TaxID=3273427 RepID=UPI0036176CB2
MSGDEWPIAIPGEGELADPPVDRAHAAHGGRLATALADFFLDPAHRLTEQERSLMTAMLHGLIGGIADEIRVRVPSEIAARCDFDPAELTAVLTRAGHLQGPDLMRLLLCRADTARITQSVGHSGNGNALLQRLASGPDGDVAAAAMALIIARGRTRDRFGKAAVHLQDLDAETAVDLAFAVAAALASAIPAADHDALAAAASGLLARHDDGQRADALTARLVRALEAAGQLDGEAIIDFARHGDAPLLSHALARVAGIGPGDAWAMMVNEEGNLALLLRLAGQSRPVAAALFATLSDALGITDPAAEIDRFDQLDPALVQRERRRLRLPAPYRCALDAIGERRADGR